MNKRFFILLVLFCGCLHSADVILEPISDPLESVNRSLYAFNHYLVDYALYPVGQAYRDIVPKPARTGIGNFYDNLKFPLRGVNNLLQGKWEGAWIETQRFAINSTIGVLGVFDPAKSELELQPQPEDFGLTFGHYGIGTGCFLNVPFLGPTNLRDLIGTIIGIPFDIAFYYPGQKAVDYAVRNIDKVNDALCMSPTYKQLLDSSYETYPIARTGITYLREAKIKNVGVPEGLKIEPEESMGCMLLRPFDAELWERCDVIKVKLKGAKRAIPLSCWRAREPSHRLIVILPGLGGHRYSNMVCALAELYRNAGWSVIALSSTMNDEYYFGLQNLQFPGDYTAEGSGLPNVIAAAIERFNKKYPKHAVESCSILGYSLGGLNTLALASSELPFKVDYFIAINPPRDPAYALGRIDEFYSIPQKWEAETRDERIKELFLRVINVVMSADGKFEMPVTREESEFIIGLYMRLPLVDILSAMSKEKKKYIEGGENMRKVRDYFDVSWSDYLKRGILPQMGGEYDELCEKYKVDSMAEKMSANKRLFVLHNENDFLLQEGDIEWYRGVLGDRLVVFSNGSHLGNMFVPDYQKKLMSLTEDERKVVITVRVPRKNKPFHYRSRTGN